MLLQLHVSVVRCRVVFMCLVKFQSLTHMSRMLGAYVLLNLWFILANDQCIILGVELCICALYGLSLASTFVLMPTLSGTPVADEDAVFGYFVPADAVVGKSSASYSGWSCFCDGA